MACAEADSSVFLCDLSPALTCEASVATDFKENVAQRWLPTKQDRNDAATVEGSKTDGDDARRAIQEEEDWEMTDRSGGD